MKNITLLFLLISCFSFGQSRLPSRRFLPISIDYETPKRHGGERFALEKKKMRQDLILDFRQTLKTADSKLKNYDNEGYQNVFEHYKKLKKNKGLDYNSSIAKVSYLQAENNYLNDKYSKGLVQIDEAIEYEKENLYYLILKADILSSLFRFSESLEIYFKVIDLTNDDILKLDSYSGVGIIYMKEARFAEAIDYFKKASMISEKIFDKQSVFTAGSYNNLGHAYLENNNDSLSEIYYKKAMEICYKIPPNPKVSEVITESLFRLGQIYQSRKIYTRALDYFDVGREISEKEFGKEDLITVNFYNALGAVFLNYEDTDEAEEYFNKAIVIYKDKFGENGRAVGQLYITIGCVYTEVADEKNGSEYMNRALAIFKKHPDESEKVADCYCNLGTISYVHNHLDTALFYYLKSLDIYMTINSYNQENINELRSGIGLVYHKKGDDKMAKEYGYQAPVDKVGNKKMNQARFNFNTKLFIALGIIVFIFFLRYFIKYK